MSPGHCPKPNPAAEPPRDGEFYLEAFAEEGLSPAYCGYVPLPHAALSLCSALVACVFITFLVLSF